MAEIRNRAGLLPFNWPADQPAYDGGQGAGYGALMMWPRPLPPRVRPSTTCRSRSPPRMCWLAAIVTPQLGLYIATADLAI